MASRVTLPTRAVVRRDRLPSPASSSRWCTLSSCVRSGTSRNALAGASSGASRCSARKNSPRGRAMRGSTDGSTRLPGDPSIHLAMVQGHGNRSLGTPTRSGAGISSGSRAASSGSQRCSLSIRRTPTSRRGSRTTRSSPSRQMVLSNPEGISRSGPRSRSGCCRRSNSSTSAAFISTSASGHLTGLDSRTRLPRSRRRASIDS